MPWFMMRRYLLTHYDTETKLSKKDEYFYIDAPVTQMHVCILYFTIPIITTHTHTVMYRTHIQ